MIRKDLEVFFTEDDKANLRVRKFSDKEIRENKRRFIRNRNKKRAVMVLLFLAFLLASMMIKSDLSFFCSLGAVVVAFIYVCTEIMSYKERKLAFSPFYIELLVTNIPDKEVEMYITVDYNSRYFYPVEGIDTTTNYKCLCYVTKTEYDSAKCGESLKIHVKGEKL